MTVSVKHVLEQGSMLRALGGAALGLIKGRPPSRAIAVPGPWFEETLAPRPDSLIRDYIRHVGGDPGWYRGLVPPHLFPQWSLHLAARAMAGLPYPLARAVNAGCQLEILAPLPAGQPLKVQVRLESLEADERKVIVTQRILTGTADTPEALRAVLQVYIPLTRSKAEGPSSPKSDPKSVPIAAREIAFLRVARDAGLDFAKLTGDFNPVHWIHAYARAAGFKGCILHGFGTMARGIEALNRSVLSGDARRLQRFGARFTRPLVLPAKIGVYILSGGAIFVGDAPGGTAYLEGDYAWRAEAIDPVGREVAPAVVPKHEEILTAGVRERIRG